MKSTVTYILCLLLLLFGQLVVKGQNEHQKFIKAVDLTMVGNIMPAKKPFQRVDTSNYPDLPKAVKRLLTHSAGKAIYFITNSKAISAKWCVPASKAYPNLTSIAQNGLDLYIRKNGRWQQAGVGQPGGACTTYQLAANMEPGEKECLLYLPIYNEVNDVEIGIDNEAWIRAAQSPFKKCVLIYGSSIVQGASASRPGMAYPAKLSRMMGIEFLNLGLSGSAKMEPAVIRMLNDVKADAYILDCIPNSSAPQIKGRALDMISAIQKAHPGKPIILLNSISREKGFIDAKVGAAVRAQNHAIDSVASYLLQKRTKDFYFINTSGFLGEDHEGTTDGVHPNDLGISRFTEHLQPLVADILKKYFK